MTFLEMYVEAARETYQPTVPVAVTGQTGLGLKVVESIITAHEKICGLWTDWSFLVTEHSVNTVEDTATVAKPTDLGKWDIDSFYLDRTAATFKQLREYPYRTWRETFRNGVKVSAKPSFFVIKPNKDIILEAPPNAVYALTADYWKVHALLAANSDTSLIPVRFQRVIIARAKMFFYEDQDGGWEQYQVALAEYTEQMDALKADQLPGHQPYATGSNEDLTVVPE